MGRSEASWVLLFVAVAAVATCAGAASSGAVSHHASQQLESPVVGAYAADANTLVSGGRRSLMATKKTTPKPKRKHKPSRGERQIQYISNLAKQGAYVRLYNHANNQYLAAKDGEHDHPNDYLTTVAVGPDDRKSSCATDANVLPWLFKVKFNDDTGMYSLQRAIDSQTEGAEKYVAFSVSGNMEYYSSSTISDETQFIFTADPKDTSVEGYWPYTIDLSDAATFYYSLTETPNHKPFVMGASGETCADEIDAASCILSQQWTIRKQVVNKLC